VLVLFFGNIIVVKSSRDQVPVRTELIQRNYMYLKIWELRKKRLVLSTFLSTFTFISSPSLVAHTSPPTTTTKYIEEGCVQRLWLISRLFGVWFLTLLFFLFVYFFIHSNNHFITTSDFYTCVDGNQSSQLNSTQLQLQLQLQLNLTLTQL